jgi:hypothetical protein
MADRIKFALVPFALALTLAAQPALSAGSGG